MSTVFIVYRRPHKLNGDLALRRMYKCYPTAESADRAIRAREASQSDWPDVDRSVYSVCPCKVEDSL